MTDRRFTRQQRLVQSVDFERVFHKPERRSDKYFTILYISNDQDAGRLGLAIAKKRVKRATDRNRIKRIVRESFRHHQIPLSGKDIIVLAQDMTGNADNTNLFKSLEKHWQQLSK